MSSSDRADQAERPPRDAVLIVNPTAGGGRAARAAPEVLRALREGCWTVEEARSTGLDDARRIALEAASRTCVVVTLGGDGLSGCVAGAVAEASGELAVLPGGRGNDFVRSLGLPANPVAAARAVLAGRTRLVDLGMVGDIPFVGVAGAGLDSVVQQIAESTRLRLGKAVYAYAALRALPRWRPADFELELDGRVERLTGWLVAVANSGIYGGGMHIAPGAKLADGLLDVVTISQSSRAHFLASFPRVFAGTHLSDPTVSAHRASQVTIGGPAHLPVYADGERAGQLPVTVSVRPQALRVIC